ncbi:uro-adherence factor A-like isoform X2 [Silurus meridionalis]|nr:uro-adherence factor A-like isoform X2 [Silurus meridionalis]
MKSRNAGHIIDSARIAVRKLEAVGYKPILFIGKQDKTNSNRWVADIITHLLPTPVTKIFLNKMRTAYEFILTKATSTAQQLDNDIPITKQHKSPSQEQCNSSILESESLTVEQSESLTVEQSESLTVKQSESLTVEQSESIKVEQLESLTVEQPGSLTVEQSESLTVEQSESLTVEPPESLTVAQPESLTKKTETLYTLNLVSHSSPCSPNSLSPSSSTTSSVVLTSHSFSPPPSLPCSRSLQQRRKRTKTLIGSLPPSATTVSPPSFITTDLSIPQSCSPTAPFSTSQSLSQEGPYVKKGRKGCRKM